MPPPPHRSRNICDAAPAELRAPRPTRSPLQPVAARRSQHTPIKRGLSVISFIRFPSSYLLVVVLETSRFFPSEGNNVSKTDFIDWKFRILAALPLNWEFSSLLQGTSSGLEILRVAYLPS